MRFLASLLLACNLAAAGDEIHGVVGASKRFQAFEFTSWGAQVLFETELTAQHIPYWSGVLETYVPLDEIDSGIRGYAKDLCAKERPQRGLRREEVDPAP